jgi:single-stranded DNA-binding protein
MLNLQVLAGNLTDDAKVKSMPNGETLFLFTIEIESYQGDGKKEIDFTGVKYFCRHEGYASILRKSLKKGNVFFVVGESRTDVWVDSVGNEQRTKRCYASQVKLLVNVPTAQKPLPAARSRTVEPQKNVPPPREVPHRNSVPPPTAPTAPTIPTIGLESSPSTRQPVASRAAPAPAPAPQNTTSAATFVGLSEW